MELSKFFQLNEWFARRRAPHHSSYLAYLKNKKGIFFSTDAIIALIIILIVLLISFPLATRVKPTTDVHSDVLESLSSLKVSEVDSVYVQSLVSSGVINDTNRTLLEQIGELSVFDVDGARALAADVLSDFDTNENIGIWYGDSLIYSQNKTSIELADEIDVSKQFISGIQVGSGSTGFSARAFLESSARNDFVYFGGYVGDGNISVNVDYEGVLNSVIFEGVVNNDFDLYVNGLPEGNYPGSVDEFTPVRHIISTSLFNSGNNLVEIRGDNLHIAGGFLRVNYDDGVLFSTDTTRYEFPGIDGFVNLYDGFYVPGQLTSMEVSLHLNSTSATTFLNVGNVTLLNRTTSDEETILLNDALLSTQLDYSELSRENVPLRLGLANSTYGGILLDIDVFSATDLSGSMDLQCVGDFGVRSCCLFNDCDVQTTCEQTCGGVYEDKLGVAKVANEVFIDFILNDSDNRAGLVGYATTAPDIDYHPLSNDNQSLKAEVQSWVATGNTCICCGINRAVNSLLSESDPSKFRSMVVMSDGQANVQCAEQGTGDASQDAIQAACDAFNNNGIQVNAIGFGSGADEATLQAVAACGDGAYYFADVDQLAEIYEQVAGNIIATYVEQTVQVLGGAVTRLYPDSYIEFTHSQQQAPFGLVATIEKLFDDTSSGSFLAPSDSVVLEARAVSYSGPRWTDNVQVNGLDIYNLSSYGEDYIDLGDPFNFILSNSSLVDGTNAVEITTGVSPDESQEGSASNKIIYTLLKNASSFSPVALTADGCIWSLEFEDGMTTNIEVPPGYSGTDICVYNSTSQSVADGPTGDAFELAVLELLQELDIDGDGMIDVTFSEQDLQISLDQVTGIPIAWSTEVQARRWLP